MSSKNIATGKIINDHVVIKNYLPSFNPNRNREEILNGLRFFPKYILPKFFYDEEGSELFEKITKLEEYYPTRIEKIILKDIVNRLNLDYTNLSVIELGSGDASNISLIFEQIPQDKLAELRYYPVDISLSAIEKSASILTDRFPSISINGIVTDFINEINFLPQVENRLFCLFGSTIGNMSFYEIKKFLKLLGNEMKTGDGLLLGIDMIKDKNILVKAYNDSKGITAKFNKNILNVVNTQIESNFNLENFEHSVIYNEEKYRIEMYLRAIKDVKVHLDGTGMEASIIQGETIHTENSQKFSFENIKEFETYSGLILKNIFTDSKKWFSVAYYQK